MASLPRSVQRTVFHSGREDQDFMDWKDEQDLWIIDGNTDGRISWIGQDLLDDRWEHG